jgi:hypothetical protein
MIGDNFRRTAVIDLPIKLSKPDLNSKQLFFIDRIVKFYTLQFATVEGNRM